MEIMEYELSGKLMTLPSFIKKQVSGISRGNDWHRVVQQVTKNDNKWQRMTTSGKTSDNK